ncbi:P-loop containing nucleoside triphosphate hydrolase protein [Aspergillus brunneoviolaceus CBS 621.78]|uniref:P-loop containing nucleoside triphosphate hydrolase protein n=1 Tax=Aspergillus brunneoviolaceus CBS 621.78 TaxID=1450534 RepID=A0ACD1GL31_9EURO|nr:P-loop containing nucleoside triphosphate hydrolase protein [Aspergillus brunneoviolaceus CBS 621.78]RAH49971.1 P-loop containing nucleoside triphosphate hydrolase protein [Aspergillus brunneoviolaceus CBS 621.78]
MDVEGPDENVGDGEGKWRYILCPPRFLGYSTPQKIWGQFEASSVERVRPVKPDTAFDLDLQLDRRYKSTIKALVEKHSTAKDSKAGDKDMDVIEGKVRGLVVPLHGPPGVGKTLAAETIAEATGRLLLVVSVVEIGLNTSKAENNLERMFNLAGAWEAILLVDEADVSLESQGFMVLTTNRIPSLDSAVKSRIHLATRYEDLSKEQKEKTFMSF